MNYYPMTLKSVFKNKILAVFTVLALLLGLFGVASTALITNAEGAPPSFSAVAAVPDSGTLIAGNTITVFFQETDGTSTLSLGSSCTVNGVAMTELVDLTDGLYKVDYLIGSSDDEVAAGELSIDCTLQNDDGSTTVTAFTDGNTVAIDTNDDGTVGDGGDGEEPPADSSEDDGTIEGDVTGGSDGESGTLAVTSITQEQSIATANGTFEDGWIWTFNVTVPTNETSLQMKFDDWMHANGTNSITAGSNIRISSQQASDTSPVVIGASSTYSTPALNITGDTDSSAAGRQIQVKVETRVPSGTLNGSYSTNWGILTTEE
ncbi:hypothetical protein A2917_01050 [Candidatus Nomurabacteria bacterium RIFCSPLOWO2_01_FULL_42_17]|uniref:Uncharacterized protein n=1 Tax=Candidatus Nomurabacteria bacterium RIFCSPLOWO2_01_FULL_42_17 TaxID=1801780 RepID=A0A1F6XM97_9BACT|nr:MAG: hypothetical protein A2917_01050 [Candidatus Nomurabacteria bacterium RIFCSPLOWO2_01_FULL_42_17]